KKTAARKPPARKPAPSPTAGQLAYRVLRGVWTGIARPVAALLRGIGQSAKGLDPAHRKDGLALLLLALGLVAAAGTWSNLLEGPVGDGVTLLVTGALGRLDVVFPVLLGFLSVRLFRHPEKPEANGRIVIGLTALLVGVLGLVHIATGAPSRSEGAQALRDTGGLVGWAASLPLIRAMGEPLAVELLVLLTVFGLLVVTATPVNAIWRRLRQAAVALGLAEDTPARRPGRSRPRTPHRRAAADRDGTGAGDEWDDGLGGFEDDDGYEARDQRADP